MSIRTSLSLFAVTALLALSSHAAADTAKKPAHQPVRRAEKHDRAATAAERAAHVHVIDVVTIVGRAGRPLAVFDTNVRAFRFPVGTARYSPRDQRFVPREGRERW